MRPRRLSVEGLYFHITARGNNRQKIFATDADKRDYLTRMQDSFRANSIRLLAYCPMTNHMHLLVQDTLGGKLPVAMQKLQGGYAKAWNQRYGRSGHVFGKRYDAEPVETETHLIAAVCYIHNNPVVAGMVKKACNWRWSSARAYEGGTSDIPVSKELVLSLCGGTAGYKRLLQDSETIPLTDEERLPATQSLRGLWVSGTKVFRDRIESLIDRRVERRKMDRRPDHLSLEQICKQVESRTGIQHIEIAGPSRIKRIAFARAMMCALARKEGIPAVDIAQSIRRTRSAVVHLANLYGRKAKVRV